jgi:hypothetical protein
LTDAEGAVFFYAGHGLQVARKNYLVPIDAELTTADAIEFETMTAAKSQRKLETCAILLLHAAALLSIRGEKERSEAYSGFAMDVLVDLGWDLDRTRALVPNLKKIATTKAARVGKTVKTRTAKPRLAELDRPDRPGKARKKGQGLKRRARHTFRVRAARSP